MDSHCFKLHRSYLISFNLTSLVDKISGLNPKGPYLSLEKEKENFCVVLNFPIKQESEIRKFLVAAVQQRLRNVQKNPDARAKLFFCQSNPIAFLLLKKLPIVVIRKSCYHSNVTSHFSSLHPGYRSPFSKYLG